MAQDKATGMQLESYTHRRSMQVDDRAHEILVIKTSAGRLEVSFLVDEHCYDPSRVPLRMHEVETLRKELAAVRTPERVDALMKQVLEDLYRVHQDMHNRYGDTLLSAAVISYIQKEGVISQN